MSLHVMFQSYDTATTDSTIRNPRLLFAVQVGWLLIVMLCVALFGLGLQPYLENLRSTYQTLYQSAGQALGVSVDGFIAHQLTFNVLLISVYVIVAMVLFMRRANDAIALFASLTLWVVGVTFTRVPFALEGMSAPIDVLLILLSVLRSVFILTIFCIFPNGQFVPRWSRWLLPANVIYVIFAEVLQLTAMNLPATVYLITQIIFDLGFFAVGVWILTYRQRHTSSAVQRQQTKWVVFGLVCAVGAHFVYTLLVNLVPLSLGDGQARFLLVLFGFPIRHLFQILVPVALMFSMLRYGLWNIDLVVNRSLVAGALTLSMGVVFVAVVIIIYRLLINFLGNVLIDVILAIAAAVLVVGGVFTPTQQRIQHWVDQRLFGLRIGLNTVGKPAFVVKTTGQYTGYTLGGYEVLDVLARGGMGEVYKGYGHGREAALKILPTEFVQEVEFQKRFRHEAAMLRQLNHPYIVKLYEISEDQGLHYLAMELVEGEDLANYIKRGSRPEYAELQNWVQQLASALDYVHEMGMVHRDMKPSNIMLRQSNDGETHEVVLMDFGIAKFDDGSTRLTRSGTIGTIDYMAPEQIMAAYHVDHRADIYALGVVIFELLTGERPFRGSAGQVLFAHMQQPAPDPRDFNPEIPSVFANAILKALEKNPDNRFQSVGEFAHALALVEPVN